MKRLIFEIKDGLTKLNIHYCYINSVDMYLFNLIDFNGLIANFLTF